MAKPTESGITYKAKKPASGAMGKITKMGSSMTATPRSQSTGMKSPPKMKTDTMAPRATTAPKQKRGTKGGAKAIW